MGRGAERLYGWTAEEAVGRSVQELTYGENLSQLVATGIVIEKGAWDGELRQFTKDGREVIVEGHWTLVRDAEGNPKTILAINSDITEKKKLETQSLRSQRLESIGTLASGIAHDLNNILSPILLGSQMLQMRLQDEANQRLLGVMQANAERGAEMIKQVLSFAKGIGARGDSAETPDPRDRQDHGRDISQIYSDQTPHVRSPMGDDRRRHATAAGADESLRERARRNAERRRADD